MSIGTYSKPNAISNAVGYAKFYSRSHRVVIRVYDDAGNAGTRILPGTRCYGRGGGVGRALGVGASLGVGPVTKTSSR
jgi:hypothetical protein